jgi:hypothetical protein
MDKAKLKQMLIAANQDDQRELCDQLISGQKSELEVDAALADADPTIKELRRLSAPLSPAFKERLVAQLLQVEAASQGVPATPAPAATIVPIESARRDSVGRKPRRVSPVVYGLGGLAAAAGFLLLMLPRSAELPQMSLELTEHSGKTLSPSVPAPPAARRVVSRGGCIEIGLRPAKRYDGAVKTRAILFQRPDAPLTWPVELQQSESGLIRQEGPCAQLPSQVSGGTWQLAVAYGAKLPSDAELARSVAATSPPQAGWAYVTTELQVLDSATPGAGPQ